MTPVFLPGKSHEQKSLMGNSPWGHKDSDMIEQLNIHTHTHTHTHTRTYTYILLLTFPTLKRWRWPSFFLIGVSFHSSPSFPHFSIWWFYSFDHLAQKPWNDCWIHLTLYNSVSSTFKMYPEFGHHASPLPLTPYPYKSFLLLRF